jgi:hypothetical protein
MGGRSTLAKIAKVLESAFTINGRSVVYSAEAPVVAHTAGGRSSARNVEEQASANTGGGRSIVRTVEVVTYVSTVV